MIAVLRLTAPLFLVSAVALGAQTQIEPAVRLDALVVNSGLPAKSLPTLSRFTLTTEPQASNSLRRVTERAANLFVASNDAHSFNDTFALRGLTNTPIFGDPAVRFYLDALPLGSGFTVPTDLGGFVSAELQRGPGHNTLYGRAGSAGIVLLSTPTSTTKPEGEFCFSAGSYAARDASASFLSAADGPIDAYAHAAYAARDGYITNTFLGGDIDHKESRSGLARLRFRPTHASEITLLVTALHARDGTQPLVPLGGPLYTVTRHNEGETNLDALNAALTAAWATSAGRLTATVSANDWNLGPYRSVLQFGPVELSNLVAQRQLNWNKEVKFEADPQSAVRWQIGVFHSAGRTEGAFTRSFGSAMFERSTYKVGSHDFAAFGEATFQLHAGLALTAGLRGETSRKLMEREEFVPGLQSFSLRQVSTALLPKLSMQYQFDGETVFFTSFGAGYKPGGFSAFTGNPTLAPFGPERTRTMEVGCTWSSPNKNFQVTGRVFYYAIHGYQIERSFATNAAADDYLVVNAGRAKSVGSEIEFTWQPTRGLTIETSLGQTDVTLRQFRDPYTGLDYHGKSAPFVPTYDACLRVDYRYRRGCFAGVELVTNGPTYYTESEDPNFRQGAYALLNARVGYEKGPILVTIYGQNMAARRYYSAISAGTGHGTPGSPRTFGIEMRYRF